MCRRYPFYFGGIVAIRQEHFEKANGFSNKFFGWGGEDDDFRQRLIHTVISFFSGVLQLHRYDQTLHTE